LNQRHIFECVPLAANCSVFVTIPARNEQSSIVGALAAFVQQSSLQCFQVLVFANNCTDATAAVSRDFGERHPALQVSIVEASIAPPHDHVGTARKAMMDFAAERFFKAGRPRGIIATTDADTRVAPNWIETIQREMRNADAVASMVEIGMREREMLPAGVLELYAQENAFRAAWAEIESLLDPLPEDPFPRHCSFVAAGFAVTAEIYRRAGGLRSMPALEDRTFLQALRRVDARVRFSCEARASTSGRCEARVEGGFGTLMRHLHAQGTTGGDFLVEHPRQIIEEAQRRAALRRVWRGTQETADLAAASQAFGLPPGRLRALIDAKESFGKNYERLLDASDAAQAVYPLVPVGEAIAALRDAAAAVKALSATRSSAASGAG
jgi:hypothetical protein